MAPVEIHVNISFEQRNILKISHDNLQVISKRFATQLNSEILYPRAASGLNWWTKRFPYLSPPHLYMMSSWETYNFKGKRLRFAISSTCTCEPWFCNKRRKALSISRNLHRVHLYILFFNNFIPSNYQTPWTDGQCLTDNPQSSNHRYTVNTNRLNHIFSPGDKNLNRLNIVNADWLSRSGMIGCFLPQTFR